MKSVIGFLLSLIFLIPCPTEARDSLVIADFSAGVSAEGVPMGWHIKEKSGKADYSLIIDEGRPVFRMRSAKTSFSLQKKVDIDPIKFPLLTWEWKVTDLPRGGHYKYSRTDDQAAQLFLAFSKTKAIVYVWDSTAPKGTMDDAPSPPFMTIKVVVVESGETEKGKWITESRNVVEDYRALFGSEPSPIVGVRLQTNSQHTKSTAESFFAHVAFQEKQ